MGPNEGDFKFDAEGRMIPKGILVAVGGNEDKEHDLEILRCVVSLTGSEAPRIEVITTASSFPQEMGEKYMRVFAKIGVDSIQLMDIKTREEANDPENLDRIRSAEIIFFTGGDQLRITSVMGGSAVLKEIKRRYREEFCIIAGTSAGAAGMPATMIYEGESTEALCKGSVQMTAGIGLVRNVIIDSHFIKRGRFSRVMETVTTNPSLIGLGLGEDTGVIIRDGSRLEAIGTGLVVVFDGINIQYSNISDIEIGDAIAVQGMQVHTLIKGHGYDLIERRYLKPCDFEGMCQP